MPINPVRIQVDLDEHLFQRCCEELQLKTIPHMILNWHGVLADHPDVTKYGKVRGLWSPAENTIYITTQGDSFSKENLFVLTKHLRFTVLHELRHAHQRDNWTEEQMAQARIGRYENRLVEIDANEWAEYASPSYRGLVKVTRQTSGKSGFSRMSERAGR